VFGQPPQQLTLQGIRGWMGLRESPDVLQKRTICCPAGIRIPDCPARDRVKMRSTVAVRLLALRFFRYSDSQTSGYKTRYPPQIPAVATPHPTEFHVTYYYFPIYNNGKYGPALSFFATRPVFRHELESDNER